MAGGLGHPCLKRCNLLVALGDGLLPVGAAHLRLILDRLLLPEAFLGFRLFLRLVAVGITCHVGLPFSLTDSARRPVPDSYGYRLSVRHKPDPSMLANAAHSVFVTTWIIWMCTERLLACKIQENCIQNASLVYKQADEGYGANHAS
jgi:hypothetical protein